MMLPVMTETLGRKWYMYLKILAHVEIKSWIAGKIKAEVRINSVQ